MADGRSDSDSASRRSDPSRTKPRGHGPSSLSSHVVPVRDPRDRRVQRLPQPTIPSGVRGAIEAAADGVAEIASRIHRGWPPQFRCRRLNGSALSGVLGTNMRRSTLQTTEGNAGARIEGFELFYEAEHRRLFGTLCVVTGDRAEAEDVMQEAFLRIWERWDRISRLDDPAAYLYRTAFNVFRSRLRRAAGLARRVFASETAADPFPAIEDLQDVRLALGKLPARQRVAVVLMELMDLRSDEASKILRVKPVTVRVLASQGRAALRRSLEGHDE